MMVVPQFSATEINASWGKVIKGINQISGLPPIELVFPKDITDFENRFSTGETDLIYCNPYHITMARKSQGYVPIVRDQKPLTGILIIAKSDEGNTIKSLKELNGKTLLFPSPNSFGASLYMRALLTKEHKIEFTPRYVKTHSNVIRGLVKGDGLAGGMVNATLAAEDPSLQAKVGVLYETPAVPPHPIAVHPRVDVKTRQMIQKAWMDYLKANPADADEIQFTTPELANYSKDYAPLEKLGLENFQAK